jgi:hypothetical protein
LDAQVWNLQTYAFLGIKMQGFAEICRRGLGSYLIAQSAAAEAVSTMPPSKARKWLERRFRLATCVG